jgi:Protein of unknown function (DUF1573)
MSDDFGTVNVRRGERSREIELLRQHYRQHRDALARMIAEAPSEHLATEYQRLIGVIDGSLAKLDELERGAPAGASGPAAAVPPPAPPRTTSAGNRPLVTPQADTVVTPAAAQSSRMLIIVVIGVVVLALIGWLLWRASGERHTRTQPVAEQPSTVAPLDTAQPATSAAPATTPAPRPAASGNVLKITPALQDYGTIRKGTRAVRQFTIENASAAAVPLKVARSTCKCLFYDYVDKVPAHGKETITVTVDGARAKAGDLRETIDVTSKDDPSATAAMTVHAVIR